MAYLPLSTANLPDPVIDPAQDVEPRDYFETFLYTGNGGGLQVGDVIKKPADTTTISNSLIFNKDSHLERTMTSGDPKTWTLSMWFKRGELNADPWYPRLFDAAPASTANKRTLIGFGADGALGFQFYDGSNNFSINFNRALKNPSVWTHVVFVFDSRSATTSTDRMIMYIDGVRLTPTSAGYPTDDFNSFANVSGYKMRLGNGVNDDGYDRNYSGYMAEVHYVDGAVYDVDDFGNFDANGIWIPKTVTAISDYGTNGFYLDFADNTNTTTLGEDQTANGNDFTASNLAITDQVDDSPTDNFMTMSSANADGSPTLSEGNLKVSVGDNEEALGAFKIRAYDAGKFYWEVDYVSSASNNLKVAIGIANEAGTAEVLNYSHQAPTYNTSNLIGVALDTDNQTIEWFKDNVSMGTATDYSSKGWSYIRPIITSANSAGEEVVEVNFGQRSFTHTPPTGYLALSENNITVDDQNLESPDFVWIKGRSVSGENHVLIDSVRGVDKTLFSSYVTGTEDTNSNRIVSLNKNGFTIGSQGDINTSGRDYVAWTWKAGTSVSGTTSQSKAYSGSVNTESGFAVIKYTGSGDPAGTGPAQNVPHHLNQAPEMILVKSLGGAFSWSVYHESIGATKGLYLNVTNAEATSSSFWNDTAPTSTNFTVGTNNGTNDNRYDHIAYCFHSVEGFSKCSSYEGSGTDGDGPFVYLGFRPAWVMIKNADASKSWVILDDARNTYNKTNSPLFPDGAFAEETNDNRVIDILSNGFKVRSNSNDFLNTSGNTHIYMAFAENPFKYSNAR